MEATEEMRGVEVGSSERDAEACEVGGGSAARERMVVVRVETARRAAMAGRARRVGVVRGMGLWWSCGRAERVGKVWLDA